MTKWWDPPRPPGLPNPRETRRAAREARRLEQAERLRAHAERRLEKAERCETVPKSPADGDANDDAFARGRVLERKHGRVERQPVQVVEGNYAVSAGVCPWWDQAKKSCATTNR